MEGKVSSIMEVNEEPGTPLTSLMKTFVEDSTLDRNRLAFLEDALAEIEQLCSEVQAERQRYQKLQQERMHEKNRYMQLRNQAESAVHRLCCHKNEEAQALTESATGQAREFLARRAGKENEDTAQRQTVALRQGRREACQSKRR